MEVPLNTDAIPYNNTIYDAIIIGSGILGSSLAYSWAKKHNRNILLIERDFSEPDRIVGELLQPKGYETLANLGLGECLEGIDAIDCFGYSVFFQGQPADIPYTINPDTKESYRGKSFHHGRFVQKLREFALKQPQVTKLEATVTKLVTDPDNSNRIVGVQFKTNDNRDTQLALADLTVVSDGCFSKFRKVTHLSQSKTLSTFCGYVLKDCKLPYQNKGHVVLTRSGPVLLYQIGSGETRVLVDILGELPSNSNGDLTKFMLNEVAVDLPETIKPSFIEACNTQRVRTMPNSYLPPSNNQREGVLVLGDALNMRHPLTGGGMTVALMDVEILQNLFDPSIVESFEDFSAVKGQLEKFYWLRKSGSTNINVLACALHALFQSKDYNSFCLQKGCYDYFLLGGECVNGPVRFLSGVNGNLLYLTTHFYLVCLYSQIRLILTSRNPIEFIQKCLTASSLLLTGSRIFLPLVWDEFKPYLINLQFIVKLVSVAGFLFVGSRYLA